MAALRGGLTPGISGAHGRLSIKSLLDARPLHPLLGASLLISSRMVQCELSWIAQEVEMAKRLRDLKELKIERPPRVKLSAKESLKRTQEFDKRKERLVAAIRKSKG